MFIYLPAFGPGRNEVASKDLSLQLGRNSSQKSSGEKGRFIRHLDVFRGEDIKWQESLARHGILSLFDRRDH
ncbi:hypothetical protein AGR7B_pAt0037 [Agrobacterium deltaense RV3]|nr:hypothetical protein AGR7B_pAt0037 [Agrobacterium deltaense RV3]